MFHERSITMRTEISDRQAVGETNCRLLYHTFTAPAPFFFFFAWFVHCINYRVMHVFEKETSCLFHAGSAQKFAHAYLLYIL